MITNTSKPSTSVTNASKVNFAETWATITTTWATETRTWIATGSLFSNITRATNDIIGLWTSALPWSLSTPWTTTTTNSSVANIAKPA